MAIYQMIKMAGGVFAPAYEMEAESLKALANNEQYEVEIKRSRNPAFHRKVFAFFNFCFEHWSAERTELRFQDEKAQFDTFRKHLTVLAGFRTVTYKINGEFRVEAKSLSYANMEQEEFEQCYSALINAALVHIFANTQDEKIINQLYAFFW
ncbi:DUF1367 family protein [Volucribacter amazonae]|uniref:DUF1367 family protein n=1 Tax=Volucribacter amazonae TaxID=256731 RepID=A0A9X4P8P4_9PAST|nr:DUF1367 family protein [Volucribacter amazonae]MDG6894543.1 hypothetical protein [Volucribacter amazonae]